MKQPSYSKTSHRKDLNIQNIETDFDIADAELVKITQSEDILTMELVDWREAPWIVTFTGVEAYRWSYEDFANYVFEHVSVVIDSEWIKELLNNHNNLQDAEQSTTAGFTQMLNETKLTHYLLTINGVGTLEVAATSISFQKSPIKLIYVLNNAEKYQYNLALYCQGSKPYEPDTKCAVLDSNKVEDTKGDSDLIAANKLEYKLGMSTVQDIVIAIKAKKQNANEKDLMDAFNFYMANDAFM